MKRWSESKITEPTPRTEQYESSEKAVKQWKLMRNALAATAMLGFAVGIVGEIANGDQEARRIEKTAEEHARGNYDYPTMQDTLDGAWPAMTMSMSLIGVGVPALICHLNMREQRQNAEKPDLQEVAS